MINSDNWELLTAGQTDHSKDQVPAHSRYAQSQRYLLGEIINTGNENRPLSV